MAFNGIPKYRSCCGGVEPLYFKRPSFNNKRLFAKNYIPTKTNSYGLKLILNNNHFSLSTPPYKRIKR